MEPPEGWRETFLRGGETRTLRRKTALLDQGDVSTQAFFVDSGCLRLWYNDDGNDLSIKFFLPGDMVASLESFYLQEPSRFGIEAIVPSVVHVASRQAFMSRMAQSQAFREAMFKVAVQCMSDYQTLFLDRIKDNPENGFRRLMAEHPRLLEVIPQHYVASYLGVTPVSLSRIRRKIGVQGSG